MKTEIEAKFINVNFSHLREKLKTLGAKLVFPERLMKRKNFDYPDRRIEKKGGWIRLRDEGDKITLSYKRLYDRSINGTKELRLEVSSFAEAEKFLNEIGLEEKSYQETRRESWVLGSSEIEIDTWPWIPSFVEIEGVNESTVKDLAENLGFDWSKAKFGSVENIFQDYFNVADEEIYRIRNIIFSQTPEWLEKKRKLNSK